MGTLAYLPKITGNMSLVREMAYTAQWFPATKAEQMGLVSKVVDGGKNEVVAATADAIDNVKATGMGILTSMMMPILRDDENILHYRSFNFSVMIL